MKTFLFPTDFSDNAAHAIGYGHALAAQVKANMVLCNAVTQTTKIPQPGPANRPIDETELLLNDSELALKKIKGQLDDQDQAYGFSPVIACSNQVGSLMELIAHLGNYFDIGMVITSTHGSGLLNTLLLGDHSRKMIDEVNKPLLLVPPTAQVLPIKKIAFATDFKNPAEDLYAIYWLIELCRPLHAEILITHIYQREVDDRQAIELFMQMLANNANYPNIYYRELQSDKTTSGFDWLCEHGQIDILAMVHRSHTFFDSLFRGSQTHAMAGHIAIPLLVFPSKQ